MLGQDLRYTLRLLARSPGFSFVAILTLAVGIGANTAVFSVVRGVLLRPLPYHGPDELVRVYGHWTEYGRGAVSLPEYDDYRREATSVAGLAAFGVSTANISGEGPPERVTVGLGTATLLPLLGVAPRVGRWFAADEDQPGRDRVALISDGFWQRRFAGDPRAIGKSVRLDGAEVTIIGVLPADFVFPNGGRFDVCVPDTFTAEQHGEERRGNHRLAVVARLQPGTTLAAAQADLDGLGARLRAAHPSDYPGDAGWHPLLVPVREQVVGGVRASLLLLLGAAGLVLLIACANVANLLLGRSIGRERELSVRAALGAGRARLIRLLLTESLVLAVAGGALGLLCALWGVDALLALAPSSLPRSGEVRVDGAVLGFGLALTVATSVLFGLVPALQASRVDLHDALRSGSRTSASPRARWLRRGLVVAEVALALVLATGAGLVTRSFAHLTSVDSGIDSEHAVTARVSFPSPVDAPTLAERDRWRTYFSDGADRLRELPGVSAAGAIDHLPFDDDAMDNTFDLEDFPTPAGAQKPDHQLRIVTPGAFAALGMPLRRGRSFTATDRADSLPVVIINQALATRYWHDGDPVGRRLRLEWGKDLPWATIVGVVGDTRELGLDTEPQPTLYYPLSQLPIHEGMSFVVRSSLDDAVAANAVRAALASFDAAPPVFDVKPLSARLADSLERRRFVLVLFELFAALALVLAAVGLYGVVSHAVAQRTHEIGVRMALGARRRDVLAMVAREGAALVGAGLAIGLVVSLAASRLVAGLLYQVSPSDPLALAAAAAVLATVAAVAMLVPARRATRIDAMVALRDE